MEGIPNVKPVTDMQLVAKLQSRIQQLCGFKSNGFAGCQPVSMDRKNLLLLEKPYMVSWKADGTRSVGSDGWLCQNELLMIIRDYFNTI